MREYGLLFAGFCLLAGVAIACGAEADSLFPFVLPWDDASAGITNMSGLLEKPAGKEGFVVARDGHLYEGERRLRIFGVNTVFGANFPTHEDAERVAARMARFGINCVRFHHMDNQSGAGGIWSADMETLDPGQLDKLDYFIAQLKKNGIYADLNLHVSREDPGMPKWGGMPSYFKGVDNFYPPMIAMQKDYARQLLTHVNPYTKNAYVNEPAVALIEINNENGLVGEWWKGTSLDGMSDVYAKELERRWNAWLAAKYPNAESLRRAWSVGEEAYGAEMLKDGTFGSGVGPGAAWYLEQHEGAAATADKEDGLRINVEQPGTAGWHVQLGQGGLAFVKGKNYTVTFRAKADDARKLDVIPSQGHAPWKRLAAGSVNVTGEWKEFRFTFQPYADEPVGRLVFSNMGMVKGNYWLADVSLRAGGVFGSGHRASGEPEPIFRRNELAYRTPAAQEDWMAFLYATESDYWTGMERFLKEELGARSLIVGTATGFSPPVIQAKLDVVDGHAYWQHPEFPHREWDPVDWMVRNVPMAGAPGGGTVPGLAERRVAGKPFICTEYNTPAPNTYGGETLPLLSAYAALQDWDGVFVFAYSHRHDDWDARRICGFFDLDQNPVKLATLPAAVSLFVRGDVSPAKEEVSAPVSWEGAIRASLKAGSWWDMTRFGVEKLAALRSLTRIEVGAPGAAAEGLAAKAATPASAAAVGTITSDTGELTWGAKNWLVTIDAPRSRAFVGRVTGGPVRLGDVTIEPLANLQNWAVIAVTAMDGRDVGSADRLLITAVGYQQNTGMRWGNAEMSTLENGNWGVAPSLVEGIGARITLPFGEGAKAWALDERGRRSGKMRLTKSGDGTVIEIGPGSKTLWYEVER